jgi:hypothetical protein
MQCRQGIKSKKHDRITADDVRRILLGFIYEEEVNTTDHERYGSAAPRMTFPTGSLVVTIQHSSVLEYLTTEAQVAYSFSTLALHSEAANLRFRSFQNAQHINFAPDTRTSPRPNLDDAHKMRRSKWVAYSTSKWPRHCHAAFQEDETCPLVKQTQDFISSKAYDTWNNIAAVMAPKFRSDLPDVFPSQPRNMWHRSDNHCPGFVIACFSLGPLLRVPRIRSTIRFHDKNGSDRNLLVVIALFSDRKTLTPFFESSLNDEEKDESTVLIWILVRSFPEVLGPDADASLSTSEGQRDRILHLLSWLNDYLRSLAKASPEIPQYCTIWSVLQDLAKNGLIMWLYEGDPMALLMARLTHDDKFTSIRNLEGYLVEQSTPTELGPSETRPQVVFRSKRAGEAAGIPWKVIFALGARIASIHSQFEHYLESQGEIDIWELRWDRAISRPSLTLTSKGEEVQRNLANMDFQSRFNDAYYEITEAAEVRAQKMRANGNEIASSNPMIIYTYPE